MEPASVSGPIKNFTTFFFLLRRDGNEGNGFRVVMDYLCWNVTHVDRTVGSLPFGLTNAITAAGTATVAGAIVQTLG